MYHGRDIFQGDATAYAHDLATVIVTETLTFGIFSLLIVFSTYHLLVNGVKARARQMLLLVTIVMYAGAATHWAARLVSFYLLISQNFYAFNAVFSSAVTQCAPTALLVINIVLSDAIVLSRAWILWSQNRYIQAISTALLLCTLALSAGNSRDICRTFDFGGLPQVQPSATVSDDPIGAAAFSFSLATNLWSTSLVAYKAWMHRRDLKEYIRRGNARTKTQKILELLVESGAIYCMLWVYVVGYTLRKILLPGSTLPVLNAGDNFVKGALIQLVGIYPTVVIILVCLERTHCDQNFTYPNLPPIPIRPEISLQHITVTTREGSVRAPSIFIVEGNANLRELASVHDGEESPKESAIASRATA